MRRRRLPLIASAPVSSAAAAPERAGRMAAPAPMSASSSPVAPSGGLVVVGVAAPLVAIAFLTSSSSGQTVTAGNTWTEIGLIAVACLCVGAVVLRPTPGRGWGLGSVGLFTAFTAFTALSIAWSVVPDRSWFGTDQLIAYLAAFTAATAAARLIPGGWSGLLGGLVLAGAALCAWSLLVKVFPASLAPDNAYGRLTAPFGYWNAIGVVAALGIVPAVWCAARPAGGPGARVGRALSAPALTLMLTVAILSLSRSALLVAVIALAIWFVLVPLRLRSLPMLAVAAAGTLPLVLVALSDHRLSGDSIAPAAQDAGGHHFGIVLVVVIALVTVAGGAVAVGMERVIVAPRVRRRIGTILLGLLACLPVLAVVALAASSRGLFGEISHAWSSLTSTNGGAVALGNTSQRLTQLGSSRPLYWHQGLQVGSRALLKGVGELGYGVARLRVTTVIAKSDNAHSYLIQTFADLGLIGVALTLALLVAWSRSAWRSVGGTRPWTGLSEPASAERAGLVALAAVVVAFGVQSSLDWTWYFPGVAVPALLTAGWLAGRGPLLRSGGPRAGDGAPGGPGAAGAPKAPKAPAARPLVPAALLVVLAVGLVLAWLEWEPLHSTQQLTAAESAPTAAVAFADARASASSDPLAPLPHDELAVLLQGAGRTGQARAQLLQAVAISPADPGPWLWLARFDVTAHHDLAAAREARRVLSLDHTVDPTTVGAGQALTQALADLRARRHASATAQRQARARSRRRHRGGPAARSTSTST